MEQLAGNILCVSRPSPQLISFGISRRHPLDLCSQFVVPPKSFLFNTAAFNVFKWVPFILEYIRKLGLSSINALFLFRMISSE